MRDDSDNLKDEAENIDFSADNPSSKRAKYEINNQTDVERALLTEESDTINNQSRILDEVEGIGVDLGVPKENFGLYREKQTKSVTKRKE